ncbi:MAG TPA: aminotransferase class V-fold PLP-dependent enzyme [Cyclobacteriaceae bacterium]|nr:aminotransferase class V-fold PLP-dependent enzyme [Cyclobacteriaceae bacterium]
MVPKINFTPGPSQLYFTVEDHIKKAFRDGIPSLSHRTKEFESISKDATDGLRELLNVPTNYQLVFCASATEIWERIIQNLVEENSHHLVNGAFSKKFFETATQLNKKASKTGVNQGEGFEEIDIPSTELIALTQNETSTGVSMPVEVINSFRDKNPTALIAVDAVSSLPYPAFDYSKIDSVFFSVQKGFGLPAGLGIWMVNERCIAKAETLLSKGLSIGSYHSLPSLISMAKKNQTPETPNVLGIYLLSKIVQDMLRRGIQIIRKETEYKAAILYQTLSTHPALKPFIKDERWRSKTVVVAECGDQTEKVTKHLLQKAMQPGDGYGGAKTHQLRFANFPAHSKEQYELLADTLQEYRVST